MSPELTALMIRIDAMVEDGTCTLADAVELRRRAFKTEVRFDPTAADAHPLSLLQERRLEAAFQQAVRNMGTSRFTFLREQERRRADRSRDRSRNRSRNRDRSRSRDRSRDRSRNPHRRGRSRFPSLSPSSTSSGSSGSVSDVGGTPDIEWHPIDGEPPAPPSPELDARGVWVVPDSRVSSNAHTPVRTAVPWEEEDEEYLDVDLGPPEPPAPKIIIGESPHPSL